MIRKRSLLFSFVAALLIAVCPSAPAPASDNPAGSPDMAVFLKEIGKSVSDFTTLRTDFVQEKEMALFKDKLVMKGRIFLQKPDKVAWHVDSPVRYSVLITNKLIRQWDEDTNKVQEVSLAGNPVFQNALNQLTVWFSGDYSSLLSTNRVRRISDAPLVLEFVPSTNNVARKVIKSITITFRDDRKYLRQIRIREQGGDVTSITFNNTLLNVPLDSVDFEVRPVKTHAAAPLTGSVLPAVVPGGVVRHG